MTWLLLSMIMNLSLINMFQYDWRVLQRNPIINECIYQSMTQIDHNDCDYTLNYYIDDDIAIYDEYCNWSRNFVWIDLWKCMSWNDVYFWRIHLK